MSQAILPKSTISTGKRFVADSFSKSVILIGSLMILQRGVGFLRSFYVCGMLSPAEVGQWDLAFSFLMLVAPLAVLGIPGSFGRYIAHFEKRDQQGRLLRQTFFVCFALILIASGLIYVFRIDIARLFLGSEIHGDVVALLAAGLQIIVFFNFATCWFTGQRLNRIVFRIQFTQTLFFTVLCVFVLQAFAASAVSVIIAYLASCLFGLLLAASYMFVTRPSSQNESGMGQEAITGESLSIWRKILPFAIWVWVSNALINLFAVCDRLLLVNFYPAGGADVQSLVGQYHTSRIFPLLLLAVGAMAGSMMMPYLSKDWESGQRESVTNRINLMLKAIGLACISLAIAVLMIAPVLFDGIWQKKFVMGESLLPLTLSYCSLASMTLVAQKYFWCIEKIWYSSCILIVGVAVNFVLGLALIKSFGIEGVVVSTLLSHAVVLVGVLAFCKLNGMRIDGGVLIVAAALSLMCFGIWAAVISWVTLLAIISFSQAIFSDSEKQIAISKLKSLVSRIPGALS